MKQPAEKPPPKPTDLLTRRVIARAKTARFIAVPVAILGDPEPGRSALEQREPEGSSLWRWRARHVSGFTGVVRKSLGIDRLRGQPPALG